jgi:hypothetical protein
MKSAQDMGSKVLADMAAKEKAQLDALDQTNADVIK